MRTRQNYNIVKALHRYACDFKLEALGIVAYCACYTWTFNYLKVTSSKTQVREIKLSLVLL